MSQNGQTHFKNLAALAVHSHDPIDNSCNFYAENAFHAVMFDAF